MTFRVQTSSQTPLIPAQAGMQGQYSHLDGIAPAPRLSGHERIFRFDLKLL